MDIKLDLYVGIKWMLKALEWQKCINKFLLMTYSYNVMTFFQECYVNSFSFVLLSTVKENKTPFNRIQFRSFVSLTWLVKFCKVKHNRLPSLILTFLLYPHILFLSFLSSLWQLHAALPFQLLWMVTSQSFHISPQCKNLKAEVSLRSISQFLILVLIQVMNYEWMKYRSGRLL